MSETRNRPPRRRGLLALGVVASVLTVLGIGGWGSAAGSSGASAPVCLPAKPDTSAKLPGVPVDVSPAPGSVAANPGTQISFLGASGSAIHVVSVSGAASGHHAGHLAAYSQGDGASFVVDAPFTPGERVTVAATITGRPVRFRFRVDTPYSTSGVGEFKNPQPQPDEYQSFGTLPGVQAPVLTVTTPDRDPAAGDIFTTTSSGPGRYGPLIYTPQGRLVWFDQLSGGLTAENLSVQNYGGERDLTFWQGRVLKLGFGQGEDVVMNSRYRTVATVKAGDGLQADLHEFQIAPGDIAYLSAVNTIRCNLATVHGPRDGAILDATMQAIDIKTGLVRWEWHSIDHVKADDSETSPPSGPWDWFHINSIDPQPGGDVFISARNTWAGYQIQGGSGKVLWTLGGLNSSFKMGAGTKTYWQHDGRILADGDVTLFDDGSDPPEERESRGVRIGLDFATHEARLVSAYTHPSPPLLSASQGNMQTLADGNTVVDYGGIPQISEYSIGHSLVFDAHLPYDMTSYRGFRFTWSARPSRPPVVVANLNNTGLETIVQMSWNGATGVAAWRVLGGRQPGSLAPASRVAATGFESSTILLAKYRYVAVAALDAHGNVLGTSHPVRVGTYASAFPAGRP